MSDKENNEEMENLFLDDDDELLFVRKKPLMNLLKKSNSDRASKLTKKSNAGVPLAPLTATRHSSLMSHSHPPKQEIKSDEKYKTKTTKKPSSSPPHTFYVAANLSQSGEVERLLVENQKLTEEIEISKQETEGLEKRLSKECDKRKKFENKYMELEIELLASYSLRRGGYRQGLEKMRLEFEESLKQVRSEVESELQSLKKTLKEKNDKIQHLEESENKMTQQFKESENTIEKLQNENVEYSKRQQDLDNELKEQDQKIKELIVQRNHLAQENEILNAKLRVCREPKPDLKKLEKAIDMKINQIREQYQDYLQETITQLKESITERSKAEEQNIKLRKNVKELEANVNKLVKQHENEMLSLQEKYLENDHKKQKENQTIIEQNQQLSGQAKSLQLQVDELKVKLSAQEELATIHDWDIENMRKEFEGEHSKHAERIGKELKTQAEKTEKIKNKNRRFKSQIEDLQKALNKQLQKQMEHELICHKVNDSHYTILGGNHSFTLDDHRLPREVSTN